MNTETQSTPIQVLLAEDDKIIRQVLTPFLEERNMKITAAEQLKDIKKLIEEGQTFSLALVNQFLKDGRTGRTAATLLKTHRPDIRVVEFTIAEFPDMAELTDGFVSKFLSLENLLDAIEKEARLSITKHPES